MKNSCLLYLLFLSFFITAQQKEPVKKTYIKYSSYKEMKKGSQKMADSLGFTIFRNDTMIEITPMVMKGVSVPYEYKDSLFLKEYKKLVYNKNNKRIDAKAKPVMKYWKNEIKVYFDSTVTTYNKRELTKFMKFLDNKIDSLKISFVRHKAESNYFVYFINKPTDINWDERITSPTDGYYMNWDGKQRIYNCTLKLDTQKIYNQQQQSNALKRLFVLSLGNFYTIEGRDCKSYLSACFSSEKELLPQDIELLQYHYSYGICKGTDLETFEENHRKAQQGLKENPPVKMEFIHPKN